MRNRKCKKRNTHVDNKEENWRGNAMKHAYQHKMSGIMRSKNEYRSRRFINHSHPTIPHIRRTFAIGSINKMEIDAMLATILSFLFVICKQTIPFCK